ncbi:MAG: fumarate/nitrate reduction transcriptional regulator Fnr [Gammaproteobacteria bacterium]|nr:fumarate/nitrate reduction transcriptional regulator Fnr [Gammaproteobacteria bacterium]
MQQIQVACQNCALARLCLPVALGSEDLVKLDGLIKQPRAIDRNEHLFHMNDPFESLYIVRSGCIKTYTPSPSGEEQVTGFYLPGELFGLSGINSGKQPTAAQALERTNICELPFSKMDDVTQQIPALSQQIIKVMSDELMHDQELLGLLGKKSAEARIAAFLTNLAKRCSKRHLSATEITLNMSRSDIGNYLGLAEETVSRTFTRFVNEEILSVQRREVSILDPERLQKMTCSS